MTTFVLIPGAGGRAWSWHRLVAELRSLGHTAIAVELPADDDSAGLVAYADAVVRAVDVPGPVTLVAQSMGGLVAPLVCDRLEVEQIVLLNAMTPSPGETGGDWWVVTGQAAAARAYAEQQGRDPATLEDPWELYFHDADPELLAEAKAGPEVVQSGRPFADPWPLAAWPDVPTRFLAARDDRLFPLDFQRRIVAERLGLEVEVAPGGHLNALTQAAAIARLLTE
ncbi:Alpha/beta hydrolase family protein [Raineyella antarctica]|uniref:Alpha/beta hydrolase family protein n=1 Tax=Raineyella antarctica TaxID=1577474 RepID=A0A1G6IC78_9ACTN|nr:alpha/beta hydrolase [Raineyella antarctica]SDC04101.1 Alpha/beta hydrolase family protein [Raineyella antarctica]